MLLIGNGVDLQFCIRFLAMRHENALGQTDFRFHGAEKSDSSATLNEQGGEIVDIEIADDVGLVFDIDPDKVVLRMPFGQLREGDLVLAATAAPLRAQAGDHPFIVGECLRQRLPVVCVESGKGHARYFTLNGLTRCLGRFHWD